MPKSVLLPAVLKWGGLRAEDRILLRHLIDGEDIPIWDELALDFRLHGDVIMQIETRSEREKRQKRFKRLRTRRSEAAEFARQLVYEEILRRRCAEKPLLETINDVADDIKVSLETARDCFYDRQRQLQNPLF